MITPTPSERQQAATLLGMHEQYLYQVLTNRRRLPAEKCPDVERVMGVHCEKLRPDITWVRIPDPAWTWHPDGRPLIDAAAEAIKASA